MILRRNYVIILIIMAAIFVLFQFSQIAKGSGNDYLNNDNLEISIPERIEWKTDILSFDDVNFDDLNQKEYAIFIGDESSNIGKIVTQWAQYTRTPLVYGEDLELIPQKLVSTPKFIAIDSAYVDCSKEIQTLKSYTDEGISLVFCTLPDVKVIDSNVELKQLLGILYVEEEMVEVEGMKLFDGFLLGGETIYQPQKKNEERRQDLNLNMPWYVTAGGTKTYMVGLMDSKFDKDNEIKNDLFPAVLWRNSLGKGQVFCVNGDYMSTTAGLGILSSIIYELSEYQLYPVVNAQNTLLVDFPLLSDENSEQIGDTYTRSYQLFQNTVVWPTLIALSEKDNVRYTCLLSPKYNYADPAEPNQDFYMTMLNMFNERKSEVGYSLEHTDDNSLNEKISYDSDFFMTIENRYTFSSAFFNLKDMKQVERTLDSKFMKEVRTLACDADINIPILSYINDDVTLQSLTSSTKDFTYSQDLMLKSIETALGYDNAKLDFTDVLYPENVNDEWQIIYDDMSSALSSYWKPFKAFDKTSLTESDQRVRVFLNLNSKSVKKDNEITLDIEGRGDNTCYFLLRTHGKRIDYIEGADYEEVEEDAFLLTINSNQVKITLGEVSSIK